MAAGAAGLPNGERPYRRYREDELRWDEDPRLQGAPRDEYFLGEPPYERYEPWERDYRRYGGWERGARTSRGEGLRGRYLGEPWLGRDEDRWARPYGEGWGRERWKRDEGYGGGFEPRELRGTHTGKGPKGYRRSDLRIREDVNDALTRDPDVDATHIEVKVDDGDVTLAGTVEDRDQKRAAERCAEDVDGVLDVTNQLRIERRLEGRQHETEDERRTEGRGRAKPRGAEARG